MNELVNYQIDSEKEIDFIKNKNEYDKRFEERYKVLESNIHLVSLVKDIAVECGNTDMTTLWNAFGYLNLLSYDLISVGYSLLAETKKWQKVYFARQVALLLYEGKEDIPDILGRSFKFVFDNIAEAKVWLDTLKVYMKDINDFKRTNHEYLRNIRMNVAGHRDKDIHTQLSTIQNINPYKIEKLMFDFDGILRKLIIHLQSLLVYTLKPESK